ncbi:MAG TPA: hypothetical protein VFZ65_19530 [Planctomycetota bacterium]|nr:hypothetical protein [Planctomycetota bacterium]
MNDPTSAPPPSPSTLSEADRALLAHAAELHRPLARAAKIANGNGLGYVIFGGLSLMFSLVGFDVVGLAIGAVLLGVGLFERKQAAHLLRADAQAPLRLARGELVLLAAIVVYALLCLLVLPSAGDELKKQLHETRSMGIDVQRLADSMARAWYGTVIAVSLLYQGGMARYFQRRGADVTKYVGGVPAWARKFVESMAR